MILPIAADAPAWVQIGAKAILYAHITGGSVGLASGTVAIIARKGGRVHRASGNIFFAAMLVMAGIGAVVAPFLPDRISSVAGFMTLYLLVTGWATARKRDQSVGAFEIAGFCYGLACATAALFLAWLASQSPTGTLDGSPKPAFFIFSLVSAIAALSDLKVILRRGISGAQRVARHVWRMCFGLFVATGSFFLGQAQLFPAWLQDSPTLFVLALAPLPLMIFWLLRVRLSRRWRGPSANANLTTAGQGA